MWFNIVQYYSILFKKTIQFTGLLLCFIALLSYSSYAEVVGTFGNTYSITEQDAYEEIIQKVQKHNWQKEFAKIKKDIKDSTTVSFKLKHAKENKSFYVDPAYTLEFDITDEKGNILYPKGYTFNPLQYMQFPYILVFFDANSATEIQWLKSQDLINRWDVMLIATNGDAAKTAKMLNKTVYVVSKKMLDRFQIKATPSILYAQNKMLLVQEVGIYNAKK
jgi:hypothetical protein